MIFDRIKAYWLAEGLPANRLEECMIAMADQHHFQIPTKILDRPEQARVSLDPKSLVLDAFKNTGRRALPFEPGVTILHGANDAGKSSMIQALEFALRGDVGTSVPVEDLITRGQVAMSVRLDCGDIQIGRGLQPAKKGKLERWLEVKHAGQVFDKPREAADTIALWAGMDLKVLCQTVLIQQGEIAALLDEQPGPRRELFFRMLGLDCYEAVRQRFADLARDRKAEAEARGRFSGSVEDLEAKLKSLPEISETQMVEAGGKSVLAGDDLVKVERELAPLKRERELLLQQYEEAERLAGQFCPCCKQEVSKDISSQIMDTIKAKGLEVRARIDELEARRTPLENVAREATAKAHELRQIWDERMALVRQLELLTKNETPNEVTIEELEVIAKTFSKSGYPLWEAAEHVKAVNAIADQVATGDTAYFFRPDLSIGCFRAHHERHEINVKLDSGSARQRGALALRVAMSIYQQRISGVKIPFLWIDELPYQDERNMNECMAMLSLILSSIPKIVVNSSGQIPEKLTKHPEFRVIEVKAS